MRLDGMSLNVAREPTHGRLESEEVPEANGLQDCPSRAQVFASREGFHDDIVHPVSIDRMF